MADEATKPLEIAIIGAGLAGTLLAISLHQNLRPPTASNLRSTSLASPPPKITIYESRPPASPELLSGVILTPNGLSILDKLGIYARIKDKCWTNGYRTNVNNQDEVTKRVLVASEELYGYVNHRIYRRILLRVLKEICAESGVEVHYSSKFDSLAPYTSIDTNGPEDENNSSLITSTESVAFTINGHHHTADLLLGTDGINSSVRSQILPDGIRPVYTGTLGCFAHITYSSITWPSSAFPRQCTIQSRHAAMFMQPENPAGDEIMIGKQYKYPLPAEISNGGDEPKYWNKLSKDNDFMTSIFRQKYDEWHHTGRKIIDAVCSSPARETLYLWPFVRMPVLERWFSPPLSPLPLSSASQDESDNRKVIPPGRVIILGDAAHAIPPSSGQGVNQAVEDAWTLTLLLRHVFYPSPSPSPSSRTKSTYMQTNLLSALTFWQNLRQSRIELVYRWSVEGAGVARMGEDERRKLIEEGKIPDPVKNTSNKGGGISDFDDMKWLYDFNAEEEKVKKWIEEQKKNEQVKKCGYET